MYYSGYCDNDVLTENPHDGELVLVGAARALFPNQ